MLIFPLRTDRRLNSTPWVNISLIVINVAVYVAVRQQMAEAELMMMEGEPFAAVLEAYPVLGYYLYPTALSLVQFITYQFLHGGPMHLIGNMIFLYVFGNSVEDRLGKVGYLAFYLAGGVVAGLGHALAEPNPVIGASGSVSAVTGAYLALFPMSRVTIVYWFLFIGTFELSGLVLILFQVAENMLLHFLGSGGVAYLAHLSGYAYGFAVGMLLLGTRLLPREPYDFPALLEQWRRRRQFRALTRGGYQPWHHPKPGEPVPEAAAPPVSAEQRKVMELRAAIVQAMAAQDMPRAADLYARLVELEGSQVLGRQQQLDLANFMMADGRHESAAKAYELYLGTYRSDPQREQIELILALLYARYLDRRQRARELLTAAMPRLHDDDQKALAQRTLAELA